MGLMGSFSYASVSPNGNYAFPISLFDDKEDQ